MIDIQIRDHRESCIGERGEAKEARGHEHDGSAEGNGRILEVTLSSGGTNNWRRAARQPSSRQWRKKRC